MCFICEESVWIVLHRQKNDTPKAFLEIKLEATQLFGSESNIWKQKLLVLETAQSPN